MAVNLEELFRAEKTFSIRPDWKARRGDEWLRLVSPIDVDGVTIEGLVFTGSANVRLLDRSVTLQIEYFPPRRTPPGGPICRVEWRPIKPHDNKGIGPKELQFIEQPGCHIHPFDLNWRHSPAQVKKGGLPIATPIEPGFATYQDMLDFVEEKFRIKGISGLPVPPWSERLL